MNIDQHAVMTQLPYPAISIASFWLPQHPMTCSWQEHAPFAFWLMEALRPHCVVELGTQDGFSLLAFSQGAKASGIECACYGVGNWSNVNSSSSSSDDTYRQLTGLIERDYFTTTKLRNMPVAEAALYFSDASVDLLHLTGQKSYSDLLAVYEIWLPKLTAAGIVIIHDINIHDRKSGSWQLWAELKNRHPSFEFIHGRGLGIVAVGSEIPEPIATLANATKNEIAFVRAAYGRLGRSISTNQATESKINSALEAEAKTLAILKKREHELAFKIVQHKELESLKRSEIKLQAELIDGMKQHTALSNAIAELKSALAQNEQSMALRDAELAQQRIATELESQHRYALLSSLSATPSGAAAKIHPLTMHVARYSKAHPKRIRIIWVVLEGSRMLLTLQWRRLLKAVVRRVR